MKTELRTRIDEFVDEGWPDEEILLFGEGDGDPYDRGFIGIGFQQYRGPIAIYDAELCIEALAEEFPGEDAFEDAAEWFGFNTVGAWVGEKTPMIISRFEMEVP